MPASLTNKIGFSYNYGLGENGWKSGYDENWLRADSLIVSTYGYNRATTVGLTYGYIGGYRYDINGTINLVAAGTVVLTDNTDNYVEVDPITGVVSKNVIGFTASRNALAKVTTLGGVITNVVDARVINSRFNYAKLVGETGVVDTTYPVGNAKRYGAVSDGIVDDTLALQAMLDNMGTLFPKSGTCTIPPGPYKTTAPLIPPGRNAFLDSSKYTIVMHGAQLFSYDATPGRTLFKLNVFINTEGLLTLAGGTLDGSHAAATTSGVEVHCGNVKLDRMVIRNFSGSGVTYVSDLAAPPICTIIDGCYIQGNLIGINASVSVSNFVVTQCRIEGNAEEGVLLWNAGKCTIISNTIENNGKVTTTKANLHIKGGVAFHVASNHFESNAYQEHSCVLIEGDAFATYGGTFVGNIVVGYYETFSGSGVALLNSIGLDISGGGGGAVETVVSHGNFIAGQYIGTRINTNTRGFFIGPDDFTDNFAPSFVTPLCIRYQIISNNPGIVYDLNRYSGLITNRGLTAGPGAFTTLATSALHTAAFGVKYTGGITVPGSHVKDVNAGLLAQAVAGTQSDYAIYNPGATLSIADVPTGTLDWRLGGHLKVNTVGRGLFVKEGANAKQGSSVLVAGTLVVANTSVTANSKILLTSQVDGGTPGFVRISARVPGTSFTILSSNVADTSTIGWEIFEPA